MFDAIRLYVRGFETEANGNPIRAALEDIGFEIALAADGASDTSGGIIETRIAQTDELSADDLEEMLRRIHAACNGVTVQWRIYALEEEADDKSGLVEPEAEPSAEMTHTGVTLRSVREMLTFLDRFDGWGMIATDEDLQIEAIRKFYGHLLKDDYESKAEDEDEEDESE